MPTNACPRAKAIVHAASLVGLLAGGCSKVEDALENVSLVSLEPHLVRFDPQSGKADELAPPPTRREIHDTSVSSVGGKLYVLGGFDEHLGTPRAVDVFDTKTGSWSAGADWPDPRAVNSVVRLGDQLCFLSGTPGVNVAKVVNSLQCYDTGKGAWVTKAPLPGGREARYGGELDGKLYVVGTTGDGQDHAEAYAYDPATDSWATLPAPPLTCDVLSTRIVGHKGVVYVTGCLGADGASDRNNRTHSLAFDVAAGTWKQLSSVTTYINVDERLLVVGDQVALASGASLELLDAQDGTWKRVSAVETAQASTSGAVLGDAYFAPVFTPSPDGDPKKVTWDMWRFDKAGSWSKVGPITTPVVGVLTIEAIDGVLYIVGDNGQTTAHTNN